MATEHAFSTPPSSPGGSSRLFVGQVESIDPIMGDAMLVAVRVPRNVAQQLRPGRFFEITCRHESAFDPLLRRPFSVYRVDRERGTLVFLVRPFGRGSGWMARRKIGDELDVLGPLGNAYEIRPATRNLVLVAGGVGVAPMVMMADEAAAKGINVAFLMGAANERGLLPAAELPSSVEYVVATDDGSKGFHGFVTQLARDYVQWADQIMACGPEPMYRSLRDAINPIRLNGRPPVQVSMERGMACGVGACLGCVVETKRGMRTSCLDGPVFDLDEVLW